VKENKKIMNAINKKKIAIAILLLVAVAATVFVILHLNAMKRMDISKMPIEYASNIYLVDQRIPENVVGISDYVFIGRVEAKPTFEYDVRETWTVYQVQVLDNIKNKLTTEDIVKIVKWGGPRMDGSAFDLNEGDIILKQGGIYLFNVMTREDGSLNAGGPGTTIVISEENDKKLESVDALEQTDIFKRYVKAYKNQVTNDSFPENLTSKYDATNKSE
jgi:hypothetical protein